MCKPNLYRDEARIGIGIGIEIITGGSEKETMIDIEIGIVASPGVERDQYHRKLIERKGIVVLARSRDIKMMIVEFLKKENIGLIEKMKIQRKRRKQRKSRLLMVLIILTLKLQLQTS